MRHYFPRHDAFKIGQADKIMGRGCRSPWAHMGYAAMWKNKQYLDGYMSTESVTCD